MLTAPSAHHFARRVSRLRASTIREMLKMTQRPDVISFAGGMPAAELFPVDAIAAATATVLAENGARALQYSVTEGIPELRAWIAARTNRRHGTAFTADDVLITGGSQQALDLFAKVFIDPGDAIVVENPTYLGAIQAFDAYEPRYVTVETDAHGIVPESLERLLATTDPLPKFVYLTPNFQNPTGITLDLARRRAVVALCEQYAVPVLEDDPYGDLAFDDAPLPPLLALGTQPGVTYCGTGSKMVAPGLRVAWMIVPDVAIREKLIPAKQGVDLHTGSFAQYVFLAYVTHGDQLEQHLAHMRAIYAARRDVMAAAVRATMPAHVQFTLPGGGMFLWLSVDPRIDTEHVLLAAARESVVFVPGRAFYPHRDRGDGMRLSFSGNGESAIAAGVERLAHVLAAS